jgi:hypothetical protein
VREGTDSGFAPFPVGEAQGEGSSGNDVKDLDVKDLSVNQDLAFKIWL